MRHVVPAGDVTVELDVYGGVRAGLVVAEVEFDSESESDAFRPPDWFGEEVTGANRTLACEGWPKAPPEFRLASGERVSEGLRRIARARLDEAIGGVDAAGDDALDEAVHEKKTKKMAKREHKLSDLIGEDHDLAVLQQTAERHREHLGEAERGALRELIERRRAERQRRALPRAERLYRRKPRAAVRRVGLRA